MSVAYSPDGSRIAAATAGGAGRTNRILAWDVRSGALVKSFTGHTSGVVSVAFSSDGRLLASASYDQTVRLCRSPPRGGRSASWRGIRVPPTPSASLPMAPPWPPAGPTARCACGTQPPERYAANSRARGRRPGRGVRPQQHDAGLGRAGTRGLASGMPPPAPLHVLTGHQGDIGAVAFSPDGTLIASASRDQTVRLWDRATGLRASDPAVRPSRFQYRRLFPGRPASGGWRLGQRHLPVGRESRQGATAVYRPPHSDGPAVCTRRPDPGLRKHRRHDPAVRPANGPSWAASPSGRVGSTAWSFPRMASCWWQPATARPWGPDTCPRARCCRPGCAESDGGAGRAVAWTAGRWRRRGATRSFACGTLSRRRSVAP